MSTYIDYKKCEGVAEVIVARRLLDGFRGVIQTMGLANLKPNIVCMRYPEIWRDAIHGDVPDNFFSIINDCSTANKAVVIVKGLDEWPGEYERQIGTIDLYWIVRDGGLMLLLSQLLRAKECFEHCKIQVNFSKLILSRGYTIKLISKPKSFGKILWVHTFCQPKILNIKGPC